MKKNNLILIIVALVIVGALSFFAGTRYASTQRGPGGMGIPTANNGQPFGQMDIRTGRLANATKPISGEIIAIDNQSITLQVTGNGSKIIFFSPSTKVTQSVTVSTADLAVGATISATGDTNDDGSVTAKMIQLLPEGTVSAPEAGLPPSQEEMAPVAIPGTAPETETAE